VNWLVRRSRLASITFWQALEFWRCAGFSSADLDATVAPRSRHMGREEPGKIPQRVRERFGFRPTDQRDKVNKSYVDAHAGYSWKKHTTLHDKKDARTAVKSLTGSPSRADVSPQAGRDQTDLIAHSSASAPLHWRRPSPPCGVHASVTQHGR